MKLLVAEDEQKLADLMKRGLEARGYSVDCTGDGNDAHTLASTRQYDVLVLDIMLPGRDGLSILRDLRRKSNNVPVIIVTARSALEERIEGLNHGADDYLTKPFYVDELIARVQALTRRTTGAQLNLRQVGDLTLNLATRKVSRGEESIDLTAREFNLLEYLMRSPDRVFTRTQILEHVWNYHFDPNTNIVDVYIKRLRRKIDPENHEGSIIETVRGVGYRLSSDSA